MALLTGVLVSVTELIKMHMFGIIHRLSRLGSGRKHEADLCKLSGGVFRPDMGEQGGTQQSGLGLCIIRK